MSSATSVQTPAAQQVQQIQQPTTALRSVEDEKAQWQLLLTEKRKRFEAYQNRDVFHPVDFDEFIACLDTVSRRYERKPAYRWIKKFSDGVQHVTSFTNAITSIAQATEASTIVWGGLQAIIKCATRHSSTLAGNFEILADMSDSMSLFQHSQILYPNNPELHWPLRDMFADFADYCVQTIAYLCRSPTKFSNITAVNFIRCFIDSTPHKNLSHLKTSITKNSTLFQKAVDRAHRETTVLGLHNLTAMALAVPQKSSPAPSSSLVPKASFPIETGRPTRNFHFSERAKDLKILRNALHPPVRDPSDTSPAKIGPACCVIHGLPGIGKTQTALQYTYTRGEDYDAIFWLRAETGIELHRSYAAIAVKLRLRALYTPSSSQDSRAEGNMNNDVDAAREWLETTDKRWLLIFDNVEDTESITGYIPRNPASRGAMIVTTQRPNFRPITDIFSKIALDSLNDTESSNLLFEYLERPPRDTEEANVAFEISRFVGGLPLAIATISGYVDVSKHTLAEFLAHLKRSNKIWETTGEAELGQGYDRTLGTVFEIALSKLSESSRKLLNLIAFLNADSIPEEMLLHNHTYPGLQFLSDRDEFTAMIRDLNTRQLVKREATGPDGPNLSVHRSLQLSVLHDLSKQKDLRTQVFDQALTLIRQQLPAPSLNQGFRADLFEKYRVYVPQLISLRSHSLWPEPKIELTLEFAKVLIEIGTYMWRTGQYKDCEAGLLTAEKILTDSGLDEDNVLYSDIDDILGVVCDRSGASLRAEGLRRRHRAVRIREATFAAIPREDVTLIDKIRLYNPHANLACTYIQGENFEEAAKLMDICLKQYRAWGTETEIPEQYSKYYHHSSFGLMAQGNVQKSLEFVRKACELQVKYAGPLNTMHIAYKSRLGLLLYHAGDTPQALKVLEEVLTAQIQVNGISNAQTLDTLCFIAGILLETGENEKARTNLELCLEPRNRIIWSEVGITMAEFRLAKALIALKLSDEAEPHAKIAKEVRERYLRDFPQYFEGIHNDEQAVHDQMLSFWHGRLTGKLKQAKL